MSELVLYPQDESVSFGEMLEDLRGRAADFVGRLAARAGFKDIEDNLEPMEVVAGLAMFENIEPSNELRTVYAEEEKKDEEKKPPQRPQPKTDTRPISHDPNTCTMVVCTACNRLGHPK